MSKQVLAFGARLLTCLPDLPPEDQQYWFENPKELSLLLAPLARTIEVDYDLALEQMIATGNYPSPHRDITIERFPMLVKGGKVTLHPVLVPLNGMTRMMELEDKLAKRKLRPSTLAEILAYGAKYPHDQQKFPIIALGQSDRVGEELRFPCLDWWRKRGQGLELESTKDGVWYAHYRFLAFPL